MYLVNEKDGLAVIHPKRGLCPGYYLLHILLACHGRIKLLKLGRCRMRYDLCQRGLTGAGRSVEYDGAEFIGFDRTVQEFIRSQYMLLSDYLIDRDRTHPGRKR